MKNKIRKKLLSKKNYLFTFIQFNIAGPLSYLIKENRYFLLIVNN